MNCIDLIVNILKNKRKPLAVHEIGNELRKIGYYYADTGISAALRKYNTACDLVSSVRPGTHYKEWWIDEHPRTMTKKPTRKALKKQLDIIWGKAVRARFPRCIMCGSTERLNAHHAICRKTQSDGVRWILENGVSLCVGCHLFKLHGQQADKAWLERYVQRINELIPAQAQLNIQQIGHCVNKYSISDLQEMLEELKGAL